MDQNVNQMIGDLFGKLGQAERQTGPRDPEAERVIAEALKQQPAAPYYMAQAILVQENALAALNRRVEELERALAERPAAASGGGFLSGLFGGGAAQTAPAREPVMPAGTSLNRGGWSGQPAAPTRGWSAQPQGGGWSAQPQGGGSGFLASAMTTAAGVAGGVLLANAVTGLFASEEAKAAEPAPAAEPPAAEPDPGMDDLGLMDDGGDFGGFDEEF